MRFEKNEMRGKLLPTQAGEGQLAEARQAQWARYDAMMSSVRAACARHLEIIRVEQSRADEELTTRRRTGASQ